MWILPVVASLAGCVNDAPDRTDAKRLFDAAIYGVVIDSLRGTSAPAYVVRTTRPHHRAADDTLDDHTRERAWLLAESSLVTPPLLDALEAVDRTPQLLPPEIGAIPRVQLVDSTLAEVPMEAGELRRGRVIWLSRIGYAADSARALLYAGMWCGALCGQSSYYVLQRDTTGRWHLVGSVQHTIS